MEIKIPQAWINASEEAERLGIELTVVGKNPPVPPQVGSGQVAVKADPALALTITLGKVLIAAGAASALCNLIQHLLVNAVGHARASKREELTAEDIEEAWKQEGPGLTKKQDWSPRLR